MLCQCWPSAQMQRPNTDQPNTATGLKSLSVYFLIPFFYSTTSDQAVFARPSGHCLHAFGDTRLTRRHRVLAAPHLIVLCLAV
jgi:hypothetical protein